MQGKTPYIRQRHAPSTGVIVGWTLRHNTCICVAQKACGGAVFERGTNPTVVRSI